MDNIFTCEICGGIFENGKTEEECDAEFKSNFDGEPIEEAMIVCESCFAMVSGE